MSAGLMHSHLILIWKQSTVRHLGFVIVWVFHYIITNTGISHTECAVHVGHDAWLIEFRRRSGERKPLGSFFGFKIRTEWRETRWERCVINKFMLYSFVCRLSSFIVNWIFMKMSKVRVWKCADTASAGNLRDRDTPHNDTYLRMCRCLPMSWWCWMENAVIRITAFSSQFSVLACVCVCVFECGCRHPAYTVSCRCIWERTIHVPHQHLFLNRNELCASCEL